MHYLNIKEIKDLHDQAPEGSEEKDFYAGQLIDMKYEADELNQFYLDVLNGGNER